MHYDYFLASRFRNREMISPFVERIRAKGKTVYCFLESPASIMHVGDSNVDVETAMAKFESIPNWQHDPRVKEVYETDMAALRNSDTLILLLPAGKSAHMEAGAAYGMGKKLVVIGEQPQAETLYLVFDKFYNSTADFLSEL